MKTFIIIISIVTSLIFPNASVAFSWSIAESGEAAAKKLLSRMGRGEIPEGGSIIVATMVHADDLYGTSNFGRVFSQFVGAAVSAQGYYIIDPRLQSSLELAPGRGEFILTRENRLLMHQNYPTAYAALGGTYVLTNDNVYYSLRVIRLEDGIVLSAYDSYLKRTDEVDELLSMEATAPTLGTRTIRVVNK